ncbi:hypothetical protein BaRGS_00032807, partial [Batillaria attramentaria]
WLEGSFPDPQYTDPQRVFTSCNLKTTNVNNWVRTPFIDRGDAKSLKIDIRFTMRKCSRFTDPTNLQQCKETFNMYYYEADSDFANERKPTWDASTYQLIDKVAADHLYENPTHFTINTETRDVNLNPQIRGVYFAFQDEGACVTLTSIRVYYVTCPAITVNFAHFTEVPAGSQDQGVEEYSGVCVPNSVEKIQPTHLCQTSGLWYRDPKGECVCMPGHEAKDGNTVCKACPRNQFKWSEGVGPCRECPAYSYANSEGSSQCTCESGYYRSLQDKKDLPCTRPPSEPRRLIVNAITSSSVTLTWEPPSDLGGRRDLEYRIVCTECQNDVLFRPGWHGFNTTSVTLTNLKSSSTYRIIVYAENGVSNISGSVASGSVSVKTEASAKVTGVRRVSVGPNHITIAWDLPPSLEDVKRFQVHYFPQDREEEAITVYTSNRNLTVTEFELDTLYIFLPLPGSGHMAVTRLSEGHCRGYSGKVVLQFPRFIDAQCGCYTWPSEADALKARYQFNPHTKAFRNSTGAVHLNLNPSPSADFIAGNNGALTLPEGEVRAPNSGQRGKSSITGTCITIQSHTAIQILHRLSRQHPRQCHKFLDVKSAYGAF